MENKRYAAGIYARLSVDGHNQKNDSIESQIAIAKAWIAGQEDVEPVACYTDLGKTGTNFRRKGWEELLGELHNGRINCVVVKDFSRFGRDYLEAGTYMERIFPAMGVRFVAVTDHFDSNHVGSGGLEVRLKNLVNEMYARDISAKVKASRRQACREGSFIGGCAPYGYRIMREEKRRGLAVEEEGAAIVRQIFDEYGDGKSMRQIAEKLYQGQVHRPADYRRYGHVYRQPGEELQGWTLCSVKYLLANAVYTGTPQREQDRESTQGEDSFGGKDGQQWYPAIVSRQQFRRAACRLEQNGRHRTAKSSEKEADLFAGLLYCGECMHKMQRFSRNRRTASGKMQYRYGYCCPNSRRVDEKKCGRKAVSAPILQKLAETALWQGYFLCQTDGGEWLTEAKRTAQKQIRRLQERGGRIQSLLEAEKREGAKMYAQYREGACSLQDFECRKKRGGQRMGELTQKLAGLQDDKKLWEEWLEKKKRELAALSGNGGEGWLGRDILEAFVAQIFVYPDRRVEVVLRFCPEENAGEGGG